jgi:hypothetical protein
MLIALVVSPLMGSDFEPMSREINPMNRVTTSAQQPRLWNPPC